MMPPETLRTRWLPLSTTNMVPPASTARPPGKFKEARVAWPPSPLNPAVPVPATVVMLPAVSTFRIRWLSRSEIKTFPATLMARAVGLLRAAEVAAAASPLKPAAPFPAKVVTFPPASTLRTR